jgi:uncharacterized protein YeaO (DUF488 family)
MYIHSL